MLTRLLILAGFTALQACDVGDAAITDAALIKFLSASGPWLEQVQSVDLKRCHHVTGALLAYLRTACPKLRKLAPSRWAENTALAETAKFPALEVRHMSPSATSLVLLVGRTRRLMPDTHDVRRTSAGHWLLSRTLAALLWTQYNVLLACACSISSSKCHVRPVAYLQELDLGDADTDIVTVDDLSMSQLSGLALTLKRLSLSRCRWVSSCEPLKGLTRLEVLDLSHTDVGPKALEALAELPALHTLNLTGCRSVLDGSWYCS